MPKTTVTVNNTHIKNDAKRARVVLSRLQKLSSCSEVSTTSIVSKISEEK